LRFTQPWEIGTQQFIIPRQEKLKSLPARGIHMQRTFSKAECYCFRTLQRRKHMYSMMKVSSNSADGETEIIGGKWNYCFGVLFMICILGFRLE
jgi:hypothetical protein